MTLSEDFSRGENHFQYVYLDFDLNIPILWNCITCLVVLSGNSYVKAGRLKGKNIKMTGSIVAFLVEWSGVRKSLHAELHIG